jgi:hypothetical protein
MLLLYRPSPAAGHHLIHATTAPKEVMDLLEDLHLEGRLTRQQSNQIMECVLRWVSATGTWR